MSVSTQKKDINLDDVASYIRQIRSEDPKIRHEAIHVLAANRDHENVKRDLAKYLWHSSYTVTLLFQEIQSFDQYLMSQNVELGLFDNNLPISGGANSFYPQGINPNNYNNNRSINLDGLLNAIVLIKAIALDESVRMDLIESKMLVYLYPFLKIFTSGPNCDLPKSFIEKLNKARPQILLIIKSLSMGSEERIIDFLIDSGYMPLGINVISSGDPVERFLACNILFHIFSSQSGINQCLNKEQKFKVICKNFCNTVIYARRVFNNYCKKYSEYSQSESQIMHEKDIPFLLKTVDMIIKCYMKLTEDKRANLRFYDCMNDDQPDHGQRQDPAIHPIFKLESKEHKDFIEMIKFMGKINPKIVERNSMFSGDNFINSIRELNNAIKERKKQYDAAERNKK